MEACDIEADAVWDSTKDLAAEQRQAGTKTKKKPGAAKRAKSAMPDFIPPQLCETLARPPAADGWIHEIKFDGYRIQMRIEPSIARVLAHHDGNRGFGEQLCGIFVVTADLSHWNTVGERNQGWVDGGMFAMTLALGLHAEGLGACMLNWSAAREQDMKMRACIGIPDNEIIITLIGFGQMREEFRVPVSARKPIDMILTHEPPLR